LHWGLAASRIKRQSNALQGSSAVTRLSIIIPLLGNAERMETGLVSVLANRPADCEVLLVLNGEYANAYELDDEVRFIEAPRGATWVQSVNLGIQHATGEIVHLLAPGVEVTEGWTEPAMAHFADPRVAAVSPVVMDARKPQRMLAAGVAFRRGARRIAKSDAAIGPTLAAAFYRRRAVSALGGFAKCMGDRYADADFALRLRYLGCETASEPRTIVSAQSVKVPRSAFRDGLCSERLFLRHIAAAGGSGAILVRPLVMLCGLLLRLWYPPRALLHLTGRLVAWLEFPLHIGLRRRVVRLAQRPGEGKPAPRPAGVRVDRSHGLAPSVGRRASLAALRKG
jgi:hypothetical protein